MNSMKNSDELLSSPINPFFSSDHFHAYLALLRSFLPFWQTFPFPRTSDFISPKPPVIPSIPHQNLSINNNNNNIPLKNIKKYKCDICSRAFSRSNTLVTHKRIHTGEKPFICNICNRAFRQPGNLTRHKLIHTATKPYVCAICMKAFNRLSNLQTHQRTHS